MTPALLQKHSLGGCISDMPPPPANYPSAGDIISPRDTLFLCRFLILKSITHFLIGVDVGELVMRYSQLRFRKTISFGAAIDRASRRSHGGGGV